jgi:SOS-response transcriptional repressor LexA
MAENKQIFRNRNSDKNILNEFYDIPLLGEVKIEHNIISRKPCSIGDIINNFRLNNEQTFSIQVLDGGMESFGIYHGDFLTVLLLDKIKDGEIAVVRFNEKIYVRRLFHVKGFIRLETSSQDYNPLIVDPSTPGFEIIGKVISLVRSI